GAVWVVSLCLFFFFQAEDGIRDFHVTGVQTCALPICPGEGRGRLVESLKVPGPRLAVNGSPAAAVEGRWVVVGVESDFWRQNARSEERRVGKECRCRRVAYG